MSLLDDLGSLFGGASAPSAQPAPTPQPLSLIGSMFEGVQPQGMDYAGTIAGGLGRSLLSSPSNDPLKGFSTGLQAQAKANGFGTDQDAIVQKLKALGFTDEQARTLAQNPSLSQGILGSGTAPGLGSPFGGLMPTVPSVLGINSSS